MSAVRPYEPAVPLLVASETMAAVYRSTWSEPDALPLSESCRERWAELGSLLTRALPVLWAPLDAALDAPPRGLKQGLGVALLEEEWPQRTGWLEGRSLDLALAIARAARRLGVAPVEGLATSAKILDNGKLGPVDRLSAKVQALAKARREQPTMLVVAHGQDEVEELEALPWLSVRSAEHVAEALGWAFPDLEERFVRRLEQLAEPAPFVDDLFLLAVGARNQLADWTPVARAAEAALGSRALAGDTARLQRFAVAFARDVALRHQGQRPEPAPAPEGWDGFRLMVPPHRLSYFAHRIQQYADCAPHRIDVCLAELDSAGMPPRSEASDWPLSLDARALDVGHLEMSGALARLLQVADRASEACELTERLVEAWTVRCMADQASHPLSAWLSLSAALGDREAFGRACAAHEELLADPMMAGTASLGFLACARGRGHVLAGEAEVAVGWLEPLVERPELHDPAHARLAAVRWLRAARRSLGEPVSGEEELREQLCSLVDPRRNAHVIDRNVFLDRAEAALAEGDEPGARSALDELRPLEPQPLGHLLDLHPGPGELRRVLALYPY